MMKKMNILVEFAFLFILLILKNLISIKMKIMISYYVIQQVVYLVGKFLLVGVTSYLPAPCVAHVLKDDTVFIERMGRKVYSYEIALLIEFLYYRPLLRLRRYRMLYFHILTTEERVHLFLFLMLELLSIMHKSVKEVPAFAIIAEVLFALKAQTVEASAVSKTLKGLTVDACEIDSLCKIVDVLERSVLPQR